MGDLQNPSCDCQNKPSAVSEIYYHLAKADAPMAMAYVPTQHWEKPCDLCHALHRGTIFSSLYKPFCGKGGKTC